MSVSQLRKAVLALGALTALALPPALFGQAREVVSKEVSVGSSAAVLVLEFADEGRLEIAFDDGRVLVDGDPVGSFEPGGELEAAWRELLGQAVALDDGPLSQMLLDWTVPAELAGELADAAREIDRALEEALEQIDVRVEVEDASVSVSVGDPGSLVEVLLSSVGRFGILDQALEGLDEDVNLHIDEDVVVPEGSTVEGTLVVIGGTARIEGAVDGDVVVIGGALDLAESASVSGEIRVADARVRGSESRVRGEIVDLTDMERDFEARLEDRLRRQIEAELDVQADVRDRRRGERGATSYFATVARAVGGVAQKLLAILVLALLGAAALAFAPDNVDVIAETARRSPGRSAIVGIAGTFLLLPVWVLGAVALAVSIIFIPVAIAWLPLFPLAAALAALIGYLAVARNAGEWLADSEYPWTGWIRKSNALITMVGGLVGLMLAFIAAHVLSAAPFVGFLSGLLAFIGSVITFVAIQIGFGAVLLTRAGRRRETGSGYDTDAAWEEAMRMDIDVDDAPSARADTGADPADNGEGNDA